MVSAGILSKDLVVCVCVNRMEVSKEGAYKDEAANKGALAQSYDSYQSDSTTPSNTSSMPTVV